MNDAGDRSKRIGRNAGLLDDEWLLLNQKLPHDLPPDEFASTWDSYQVVIAQFLSRMGEESAMLESIRRVVMVRTFGGILARIALIPRLSDSVLLAVRKHGVSQVVVQLAGQCALMELSAAAGYRTFCLPDLVRGLNKTDKMRDKPVERMLDTFEFLNTMMQYPLSDSRVKAQLERTNGLHAKYKVAGAMHPRARDLFKYIALNMFYIGPSMRPDLTPQERHAICGLTVLVSKMMGHTIDGTTLELELFIDEYEASCMFSRNDTSDLRKDAIRIAQASAAALYQIPTIVPARVHGYVPHGHKRILEIS